MGLRQLEPHTEQIWCQFEYLVQHATRPRGLRRYEVQQAGGILLKRASSAKRDLGVIRVPVCQVTDRPIIEIELQISTLHCMKYKTS